MNEQDIAIRLTGVKKRYKLGQIGGGTLTADLQLSLIHIFRTAEHMAQLEEIFRYYAELKEKYGMESRNMREATEK